MLNLRHVNKLKTNKRLIKFKWAHQKSHCKVDYLALTYKKENVFIIFVHAYANVISTWIKTSFRQEKKEENHIRKRESNKKWSRMAQN